jgi:hypothetical protein
VRGETSWTVGGVVAVVAIAAVAANVQSAGHLPRAARGGVAPVTTSTVVCPNVSRGPGGAPTDVTIAHVQPGPAPRLGVSPVKGHVTAAQRVTLRPAAVVHQTPPYGPLALTAAGPGSDSVVASQTGLTPGGLARGLVDTTCTPPATDAWLVGADGRIGFSDWLVVANTSDTTADVALSFWSSRGPLSPPRTSGMIFTPHSVLARPISNFAPDVGGVSVHVHANSGTVAAWISDVETSGTTPLGSDWIAATAAPARSAVVTGFMSGATFDRLDLVNPGDRDATVSLRIVTPTKNFAPAGHQTVVVPAGHTVSVDLSGSIAGEAAAVVLASDAPVSAAGQTAQRPSTGFRELAWLPAQPALRTAAAIANNAPPFGQQVHLVMTAPDAPAKVRVATTVGTSAVVSVPGGRTVDVDLRALLRAGPGGPGPLLLTPLDAPVYIARVMYAMGAHGPLLAASVPLVLPRATTLPPVVADLRAALP